MEVNICIYYTHKIIRGHNIMCAFPGIKNYVTKRSKEEKEAQFLSYSC